MKTLNLEYDPAELARYGSCPITYAGKEIGLLITVQFVDIEKPTEFFNFNPYFTVQKYEAHALAQIEEMLGGFIETTCSPNADNAVRELGESILAAIKANQEEENPQYAVTYTATAPDELSALLGVQYIVEPTKE